MIVELSELKHHPINKEIYTLSNIEELADSIQEIGLLEKLIINKDYEIISGNRRFEALKYLNIKSVEVETLKISKEEELIYLISYNKHRVKSKRELLNEVYFLSENWKQKTGRKSETEMSSNIGTQKTRNKVAEKLNISTGNIAKLIFIDKIETSFIGLIDKDEISINQAYIQCKKIDEEKDFLKNSVSLNDSLDNSIEIDDNIKLYCKSSEVMNEIEDETIQLIYTSPPYYKLRRYSENENELGSEKSPEDYINKLVHHLKDSYRVLKKEGSFFLNLGDTFIDKSLQNIPHRVVIELVKEGWILRNSIIWKKKSFFPQSNKDNLTNSYEFIFHLVKSKDYYYNQVQIPTTTKSKNKFQSLIFHKETNGEKLKRKTFTPYFENGLKNLNDFWNDDIIEAAVSNQNILKKYQINTKHPAPFSTDIVQLPLLQTTKENDICLDIFSGSGSVGEVALQYGRKYIGYDTNPNFIEVQKKRLNEFVNIT